jgi:heme-degrading monooxygenase HmoA
VIVFVNRFAPKGTAEQFEEAFTGTSDFMRDQRGLRGHRLVRSLREPSLYYNVAEWSSEDDFAAAVRDARFTPHAAGLRAVASSDPHPCAVVFETERHDDGG